MLCLRFISGDPLQVSPIGSKHSGRCDRADNDEDFGNSLIAMATQLFVGRRPEEVPCTRGAKISERNVFLLEKPVMRQRSGETDTLILVATHLKPHHTFWDKHLK